MATTLERKVATPAPSRKPRRVSSWALGALAALALAAVTVAAVAVLRPAHQVEPIGKQDSSSSLYTAQERMVMRLAAQGLIPNETLEGGIYRIKSLVNQGLIPRETLIKYRPVRPLYTEQEQLIMAAVARGQVPKETLDGEPYRTKRLINQGVIPREAAYPAASDGA
ncbi:MAG: hypothetical protein ACJ77A_14800 [Actinomycetota bacterium]